MGSMVLQSGFYNMLLDHVGWNNCVTLCGGGGGGSIRIYKVLCVIAIRRIGN